jgi:beta-glucosidase
MKKNSIALFVLLMFSVFTAKADNEIYLDKKQSIEKRVEDLLRRMTLEEKVGQMNQFVGLEHMRGAERNLTEDELKNNTAAAFYPGITSFDVERWTKQGLIGSFLHVLTIEETNHLQSLAMQSRLKIPLIIGIDAIHGNANAPDNTVYPTNIGLACSFDTIMAYKIAQQTAREMRSMNLHWTFNPNVEVARDPRWGRVGETFGEDPYLVSRMGVVTTKGYQGDFGPTNVLACIKHFVAGSEAINGANAAPADLSERTLREVFFPPFKAGIVDAGGGSLMTAHNEVNGIPAHENEWLMEDILRKEWGFKGFVVSDWMDIEHLYDVHHTASSIKEAFYQSIMAGMDMHMHGIYWNEMVCELVNEGRIPVSRIDESVRRILYAKFQLGLFDENTYCDPQASMKIRLSEEHRQTALEAARNSIVLLTNNGILPLDEAKYKKVMITGINANDQNILGDWSAVQKDENVITVLKGLQAVAQNTNITFVDQGWDPRNMKRDKVDEAVRKAKQADLNIVVAGEYMMRFRWTERTSGEDTDRSDINLVGLQEELIERVKASGKPTIVILISGRPLGVEWVAQNADALINAWEPGMYGGQAIAEILYGKVNPSAKLAITIPRHAGQIQMIYNHKPSAYFHGYKGSPNTPLFPFGHGLSYTTYKYGDIQLDKTEITKGETVKASIPVTNTGAREGVEIVQLYIRDEYSSVSRPVKELKDFARVALAPGETKVVDFTLRYDELGFLDKKMVWVTEPGTFKIMVGSSSQDKDLKTTTLTVKEEQKEIIPLLADKNATPETQALYKRMVKRLDEGIMVGHQDDLAYGIGWYNEPNRSDVHSVTGKYPAINGWEIGHIELGAKYNLDSIYFDNMKRYIREGHQRGSISTISWHGDNIVTGKSAWDCARNDVVKSILPGGKNHKKFIAWLDKVADFFLDLKDDDGKLIPVMFRLYHEHSGAWFWWGSKQCTPDEYKQLWVMTVEHLRDTRNVHNILYSFSPSETKDITEYLERYPGDDYVDIVGFDCYANGEKEDQSPEKTKQQIERYKNALKHNLDIVTAYAKKTGKIPTIAETGMERVPYPQYFTDAVYNSVKDYKVSYVLFWRNAFNRSNHFYVPYPGGPGEEDFRIFAGKKGIILQ